MLKRWIGIGFTSQRPPEQALLLLDMKSKKLRTKAELVANALNASSKAIDAMKITQRLFSLKESHILSVACKQLQAALSDVEMHGDELNT